MAFLSEKLSRDRARQMHSALLQLQIAAIELDQLWRAVDDNIEDRALCENYPQHLPSFDELACSLDDWAHTALQNLAWLADAPGKDKE